MVQAIKTNSAYEAYQLYVAIKNHFMTTYDFFKYNGKVKTQYTSFEVRRDKYFFNKLMKHSDPLGLLVSQFIDNPSVWIGDIVNPTQSESVYREWKKRQDSISYFYKENIKRLPNNIDQCLEVVSGQHPLLLKQYIGASIYPETVILLNYHYNFFPYWEKHIDDNVIWPSIMTKLYKYKPFVVYDKDVIKKITVDYFNEEM